MHQTFPVRKMGRVFFPQLSAANKQLQKTIARQSQRLAQYDDTISGFEKHLLGQPVRA